MANCEVDAVVLKFRGNVPRVSGPSVRPRSLYILAHIERLRRVTTDGPWKAGAQVYMSDYVFARYGRGYKGLEWIARTRN
jgi:hypothetical protein